MITNCDYAYEFVAKDGAGNVIKASDIYNIIILIYSDKNGTFLNKYSLLTKEGYDSIITLNADAGLFKIILGHNRTKLAELDTYTVEVDIQRTDTDYPDNYKSKKGYAKIEKFVKSKI